jgi:hypothetical protein
MNLVRRLNSPRTATVHTIAFVGGSDSDTDFLSLLEEIASENGGVYRHVTEEDLTR